MSFAKITDFADTIHYCDNILVWNWIRKEDLGCFSLYHTKKKKRLLNISKCNDCLSHLFLGVRSEGLEKHKRLYQCGLSNFRHNKGCCGCNHRATRIQTVYVTTMYHRYVVVHSGRGFQSIEAIRNQKGVSINVYGRETFIRRTVGN